MRRAVAAPAAMRAGAAALALALAAGAARAEPLTPEAFGALSDGRTLYFSDDAGVPQGAEQYLPDRRVIWQTPDGACLSGQWEGRGDAVCFAYETRPDVWRCWEVGRDARGVFARLLGAPPGDVLRVTGESERPLVCDGIDRPV